MIVMKFGGTSVGDADRISNTTDIIKSKINGKPVVVVSAVGGITDKLIELVNTANQGNEILDTIKKIHYEILEKLNLDKSLLDKDIEELTATIDEIKNNKLDNKILDKVQSFGEQMSSKIVAAQLNKIGVKAEAFNSFDLGFLTNSEFGNAEPLEITYNNLSDNIIKLDVVPVVTGFLGKTEDGQITTIGRGGSDYTAAIIGSAINADEIQIWTDVDGIMSTDPKIVSDARTLEKVSFAEASELAYFGARVLHPKTLLPAMKKDIPVRVLNSLNPKNKGTTILPHVEKNIQIVRAIAFKKNISLINIKSMRMLGAYGFLAKIFNVFDKYKKSVDVISTSEVSISLTIESEENLDNIVNEIEKIGNVQIFKNKTVICVVGESIGITPGIAGKTFSVLGRNNINIEMISSGTSNINITFVVGGKDTENAVKCLHEEYFK